MAAGGTPAILGFDGAPPSAYYLLGNLVALTSIAVLAHIQCINTHGGRYGNFSSDLRTPLGDGRFPESGYSSPAQVRSSFTVWPAPGGEVRPPVG